ncbi:MAG: amino acid adenylation domain-containing protein, partial [Planctomycetota bacterium]
MTAKPARPTAAELAAMSPNEKRQLLARLRVGGDSPLDWSPVDGSPVEGPESSGDAADSPGREDRRRHDPPHVVSGAAFPLAPAQRRLWFIDQLQPGSSVYTIPAALVLTGDVDLELLRRCLNALVARHEILRTRFVSTQGVPSQVINPPYEFEKLVVYDDDETAIRNFFAEPFSLSTGPLLRVRVSRVGAGFDQRQQRSAGRSDSPARLVLHIAIHHIVADYLSLRILMQELDHCYSAAVGGQPPELPELQIQYVDYAVWQDRRQARLTEEVEYWRRELSGVPTVLKLPTDFRRPLRQSFRGKRHRFDVPADLSGDLQRLAVEQRTTPFTVLLAAFQALLFRYSGQRDFCVGSTVSNRDREETRNLIGLFVNNVVFRARPANRQSFAELLRATHDSVINGLSRQQAPFERVVDALQIDRQLSHNPLFQVMFLLRSRQGTTPTRQNGEQSSTTVLDGDPDSAPTFTPIEPSHVRSRFDLSIDLSESTDGLSGFVEYATDLFSPTTIERFVEHFTRFLRAIGEQPGVCIGDVPLLTSRERESLDRWNDTAAPTPDARTHELFERQAQRTPDATAVMSGGASLTYRALKAEVDRLVEELRQAGCQPGEPVAICMPRGTRMVVGMLAIMKLGAYYVPLDPSHPADRRRFILEDAGARFLLGADDLHVVPELADKAVAAAQLSQHDRSPEDLAYLIYTSGSTGRPKGVPIRHRSLVNVLVSMASRICITENDTLFAVTTLAFDIATLELLLPLAVGARVVVADEQTVSDGDALLSLLAETEATIMQATPSTWRLTMESAARGSDSRNSADQVDGVGRSPGRNCPRLKVLCGGEALDLPLAQDLLSFGGELWNLYGPTETTIWSGAIRITEKHLQLGCIPIGHPLANTQFRVLDENRQEAPLGVTGELYITGDGLSPGYHRRDELTATKFVDAPCYGVPQTSRDSRATGGSKDACRAFATGDLVRYRNDGSLEFLGRIDHQVKLRGFRIELGEIETRLSEHDAIDRAIVTVEQPGPDAKLTAYCQLTRSQSPGADLRTALRKHLSEQLPAYMIPADLRLLDAFPLTPNGKIDRAALSASAHVDSESGGEAISEELTETEAAISAIWEPLLNRTGLQPNSNFFEVGGHSLIAARMIARVRERFDADVPLRAVFDYPTLREFSSQVAAVASGETDREPADEELNAAPTLDEPSSQHPLSHAQQRQWVLAELDPDNPAYNIPAAVRVRANLTDQSLREASQAICRRHDVLRTAFIVDRNNQPIAELRAPNTPEILHLDLSGLDEEQQHSRVQAWFAEQSRKPFRLQDNPLMRIAWATLGERDHVVMIVLHNIVADGWSLRILLRELAEYYQTIDDPMERDTIESGRVPGPARQPAWRYVDYAREEQQSDNVHSREYWKRQLAGVPP